MRDRFFVEGIHAAGDRVAFAPDDARKLATVLREGCTADEINAMPLKFRQYIHDLISRRNGIKTLLQ